MSQGKNNVLEVEGINTTEEHESKLYKVPIKTLHSDTITYINCYEIEEIPSEAVLPDYDCYGDFCHKLKYHPRMIY